MRALGDGRDVRIIENDPISNVRFLSGYRPVTTIRCIVLYAFYQVTVCTEFRERNAIADVTVTELQSRYGNSEILLGASRRGSRKETNRFSYSKRLRYFGLYSSYGTVTRSLKFIITMREINWARPCMYNPRGLGRKILCNTHVYVPSIFSIGRNVSILFYYYYYYYFPFYKPTARTKLYRKNIHAIFFFFLLRTRQYMLYRVHTVHNVRHTYRCR